MDANGVMVSWEKDASARERAGAAHLKDYVEYLTALQRDKQIDSFERILQTPNGRGSMGCFLIRGAPARLVAIMGSDEWKSHAMRGMITVKNRA